MASDATTLPLRDTLPGESQTRRGQRRSRGWSWAALDRDRVIGVCLLFVIVALSLLVVVISANRPSSLSSPSHTHFFPHWLAGPLGGLWPGLTRGIALRYLFSLSIVVMYASYLLGLRYVPRLPARWAIGAIVAVHAIFFLSPPLALTDIFNYVNYGRMEIVHNLNPYTTIPTLEPHNDPSFVLSNWHHLLSPYGPLFTLLTFAVVPLGVAGSFWALKGVLMVASLGTILLVYRCAQLLDRDPIQAIVFVGLNPVVLVWGLGGDHNDFIMIFLLVLGFYLLLRARAGAGERSVGVRALLAKERAAGVRSLLLPLVPLEIGAGVAFAGAIAVKASAAILLPALLASLLRSPRRLVQLVLGLLAGGIAIGACSLIAFGPHLPALGTQGRLVTDVSIPNLLGLALGQGGETDTMRTLLSGVLVLSALACGVLAWRRSEAITASGWATVALLVTLSWVLPWYVLWILPMAALSRSRALRRTTAILGAYLIVAWAPLTSNVFDAIGFNPAGTPLGQLHQRYVKELLN